MRKTFFSIAVISVFTLACALHALAVVPAPPVNQTIGVPDGIFNNLEEADCRICHEDPDIVEPTSIPDRHHLLMYSDIQTGLCSTIRGTCSAATTQNCYVDSDCPATETCNLNTCLEDSDCNPGICSRNNVACTADSECPQFAQGETCGEICIGETVAPDKDADRNGVNDTVYQCLNCHIEDTSGGIITLLVWRDCLLCHVQIPGDASVHHLTATAQGTDSPLGAPDIGDCTPCHGTLVDDIGDGHAIPLYAPSLITPAPSDGSGLPLNAYGNGAGACDYCHDQDTTPPAAPVEIYSNSATHHNTGVYINEVGVRNGDACFWCHDVIPPADPGSAIRTCEGCHGYESLHNIAIDSDTGCLFGDPGCEVVIGGETAGYSHVGNNDDCWGCHGFAQAAATGSGPATPFIGGTDVLNVTAGTDTTVTLTGSALTNLVGTYLWSSDISMTAADGSAVTLIPESVTSNQLAVTIPAATAPGNYALRAVKGTYAASNPIVISVTPEVAIAAFSCNKKKSVLSVRGSGFGEKPAGTDDYINVQVNGESVDVISWSDTQIRASVSGCSSNAAITVNALMGSATSGDSGKPAKPCKGKKCN
ncbi:MAG: hypothetical protein MUP53_00435 [Bacteroidales bacterium]|nr:hypothetical protein [Bacteroidales bacterium]